MPLLARAIVTIIILLWAATVAAATPTLLVVGDSLSAGHGIDPARGWVALLQQRLHATGSPYRVINASISGETTAGALSRLPQLLASHHPQIVVIALGGNDGLRGLPPERMRANLAAMIERARAAGAGVLLVGVRLPPNYGPAFTEAFAEAFRAVAQQQRVALVPRMLADVGGHRELMQDDGLHPNAAGQPQILDNLWPALQPLLEARGRGLSAGAPPPPAGR